MVVSGDYLIKIVLISATIHGMVGGGGFEVGNDAARIYGPWHDSAGGMNTKSELPDLPATPSPLQSELRGDERHQWSHRLVVGINTA